MLIDLLRSLTPEEWNAQTVARLWKVKDVASHLLDGNLRGLSISRDGFFGEPTENIHSYQDLVAFLNELNRSWVAAAKRLSPEVLTFLLEATGKHYTGHLASLDPFGRAVFSVAWAGEDTSLNWFHIAREYTEKFLHQQQIRDTIGNQGLLTREFYYPFLDTLMYALPHTYKNVPADNGTMVTVRVTTEIGGEWHLIKRADHWQVSKSADKEPNATVALDPVTAWKLFSKSMAPQEAPATITGDQALGQHALRMVAFMA